MIRKILPHSVVQYCYFSILSMFIFTTATSFFDNRFLVPPLDQKPRMAEHVGLHWYMQPYLLTANNGFNADGRSEDVGLFNLGDKYDLVELSKAVTASGRSKTAIMPIGLAGLLHQAPYKMNGRLEVQGVNFGAEAILTPYWAAGFRWSLIHAHSRMGLARDFKQIGNSAITGAQSRLLQELQQNAHDLLDIESLMWSNTAPGDLDVYVKLFQADDYRYRCRYFNAGVSAGILIPTAPERDLNFPSSISFGGDRHWGGYMEGSVEAILKHDLRAGMRLRMQKRFETTRTKRVPLKKETARFGSIVGQVQVDPGFTFAISPYLLFEGLRGGLGAQVGFTLVKHVKDKFGDERDNATPVINFVSLREQSGWATEHITAGFLYNFAYGDPYAKIRPVLSCTVDAPVNWIIAQRASKTYGLSCSLEIDF